MRLSHLFASAALIGSLLALGSAALAKNYPAAGNVDAIVISPNPGPAGQDLTFTVKGQGECAVALTGIANPILPLLHASGKWPLVMHAAVSQPGTYIVQVNVSTDQTNPLWGNGGASVTLIVYPTPPAINGLKIVTASPGRAGRPNEDIPYAGEDLQLQGSTTEPSIQAASSCGYVVRLQNVASGAITNYGF